MISTIDTNAYKSVRFRWFVLVYLTIIYAISFLDRQIVSILVEPMKRDLLLTDTQVGLLSGLAFAVFYATLGIPIAVLADKSNRKNIIAISLAIFSVMTALCGTATTFLQFLFYRMGVGIGEAGTSPPSHSIISDLFPPESRSGAMSVFALGVPMGIFLGFAVGGYVAQHYGWRSAFYIVGVPGVILAALSYFVIPEPTRGLSDKHSSPTQSVKILEVFKVLWRQRSAFHLITGATITSFVGYSFAAWAGSFLIRTYDLSLTMAGIALAFAIGISGTMGALSGGLLANRLRKRDIRWPCWMICIAILVSIPLALVGYHVNNVYLCLVFLSFPAFVTSFYYGPSLAMLHGVVPISARASSSAIMLLILNLVAMGLGPTVVGILSDFLKNSYGEDSLRQALIVISFLPSLAALHFYRASTHIQKDSEKFR